MRTPFTPKSKTPKNSTLRKISSIFGTRAITLVDASRQLQAIGLEGKIAQSAQKEFKKDLKKALNKIPRQVMQATTGRLLKVYGITNPPTKQRIHKLTQQFGLHYTDGTGAAQGILQQIYRTVASATDTKKAQEFCHDLQRYYSENSEKQQKDLDQIIKHDWVKG